MSKLWLAVVTSRTPSTPCPYVSTVDQLRSLAFTGILLLLYFHKWVIFSKTCFVHSSHHGHFILKNDQRYDRNARQCNQVKVRRSGTPVVGHLTLKKSEEWFLLPLHRAFGGCSSPWDWGCNGAYQPSVISHHGGSAICHSQTNLLKWQWTQLKQLFHFRTRVPCGVSSKRTAAGPWPCCH